MRLALDVDRQPDVAHRGLPEHLRFGPAEDAQGRRVGVDHAALVVDGHEALGHRVDDQPPELAGGLLEGVGQRAAERSAPRRAGSRGRPALGAVAGPDRRRIPSR